MFLNIPGRGGRYCIRRSLVFVLFLLALFATSPPAHAHAGLELSEPADGAVLSALPRQAALTFNEPVSPLVIHLISPDGVVLALDRIVRTEDGLRVDLPAQTLPGTYALSWRVASADGHPVGGTIVFSLGAASAAPIGADSAASLRQPAIWLARLSLYLGLFFAVGGAMFIAYAPQALHCCALRHARRAVWLGLASVPACLALQGLDALDAPWSALADVAVWRAALGTTYAITLALAVLALAAARLGLAARSAGQTRWVAAIGAVLLGVAFAASGHASAAPPQWLARPAVCLHTIAVAAWMGSLLALFFLARDNDAQLIPMLRRFSLQIRWIVIVLLASGLMLALLQIDKAASLWNTAYGQVLLGKLVFVTGLFLLAGWNRYRLTAGVLAGTACARLALSRIVKAELALMLCVLAVLSLWRFTPPPRALHSGEPIAVSWRIHSSAADARLIFMPSGHDRPGSLRLTLSDAKSAPLPSRDVNVSFSSSRPGIEPLLRQARRLGPGQWEIPSLRLPAAGPWSLRIDIFISDFDRIRLQGEIPASSLTSNHKNHLSMGKP